MLLLLHRPILLLTAAAAATTTTTPSTILKGQKFLVHCAWSLVLIKCFPSNQKTWLSPWVYWSDQLKFFPPGLWLENTNRLDHNITTMYIKFNLSLHLATLKML